MPYIKPERRAALDAYINTLGMGIGDAGELNYAITMLLHKYLGYTGVYYYTLNEVMGVLECVKQEFYRRVVVPYEEEKIKLNGDIDAPTQQT